MRISGILPIPVRNSRSGGGRNYLDRVEFNDGTVISFFRDEIIAS